MRSDPYWLNRKMEFDHPVMVLPNGDGDVSDAPAGIYAPESTIDVDDNAQIVGDAEARWRASVEVDGWEVFTNGYSGQYGYRGPIMHASEFIGGHLADDIMARPGIYVAVTVEVSCPHDETAGCDCEDEPAGWAVLRRDLPHADYPHTPGYLYDCLAREAECHCTGNRSLTNCVFSGEHDNPNQPAESGEES